MIGFLVFIVVIALLVVVMTGGLQRLGSRSGGADPLGAQRDAESIRRISDALTSLESRIDRIEDQQRFLERLLEERPSQGALPPPSTDAGTGSGESSPLFDVDPEER